MDFEFEYKKLLSLRYASRLHSVKIIVVLFAFYNFMFGYIHAYKTIFKMLEGWIFDNVKNNGRISLRFSK